MCPQVGGQGARGDAGVPAAHERAQDGHPARGRGRGRDTEGVWLRLIRVCTEP